MRRVVIVFVIMIAGSIARADPATADRAAAEAEARIQAKDYLAAAAKFREAYAADPRPDFICNVGVAYYKAQELTRAQLFLGRCLERGSSLDSTFMDVVRGTLSKLEAALKNGSYTPVDIVVDPRFATVAISSFDPDETFDGGRTVWLRYGNYQVTVRAEGYTEQVVPLTASDRAVMPLRVTLVKTPVVGPDPVVPPLIPDKRPPARVEAGPPSRTPALAATIATVGLAAFAVYALIDAHDHADRAGFALRADAYQSESDAAHRWNTIFGIDAAVTGVAAIASGYLWYRATRHASPATVEVSGRGAVIQIEGRF